VKIKKYIVAFNRGIVSKLGLARLDVERLAMSAEIQTNWMPRVLGSMMLRVGMGYLGSTKNDSKVRLLPFQFTFDDTAQLELSDMVMRVWKDDALITRPSVSTAVTNSGFDADVASWTDADDAGGASTWLTDGVGGGYLALLGDGADSAKRQQTLAVSVADKDVVNALRIVIARGPVKFRIGTAAGLDDVFAEQTLGTGTHSIAFTPGVISISIEFSSARSYTVLVDSCAIEAAGTLELPVPYTEANQDCIRQEQSGDVIYVNCKTLQQRRIERRDNDSWSVILYEPENGPLRIQNVTKTTITPSALSGDITLLASDKIFKSGNLQD